MKANEESKISDIGLDSSWDDVAMRVKELIEKRFFDSEEHVVIAVGGPGGTGKSTFSKLLSLVLPDSAILKLDDYKTPRSIRALSRLYGPHPDANYMDLIKFNLEDIKNGIPFFKPIYNRDTGQAEVTELYKPKKYNLLDGEVSTYLEFASFVDLSIYIDAEKFTQFNTRIKRDVEHRSYSYKKAVDTFFGSNLKEFSLYGVDTKKKADIILFCTEDYKLEILE